MDELDILLNDSGEKAETPPAEVIPQEKPAEVVAKEEQLANLSKAIAESQAKLRSLRQQRKQPVEEEEVPKIDFTEPSSRAWDKHIRESVNPMQAELDKSKDEVRKLALQEFLSDKPSLARSSEKLGELMGKYEKLRTSTETNKDVVISELQEAYAATYHKELLQNARNNRLEQAQQDMIYSDPGVSRGATAYSSPKEPVRRFTSEEAQVLAKWGYNSPAEYLAELNTPTKTD